MRARFMLAVCALLLAGAAARAVHAQGAVYACIAGDGPGDERARSGQKFRQLSPDSTWLRWRAMREAGTLLVLHDSLLQYWNGIAFTVPAAQRAMMTARLDSLRVELSLLQSPAGPRVRRFSVTELDGDTVRYALFEGAPDTRPIVRASDRDSTRLALCGTTQLAWLIATQAGEPSRLASLDAMRERAARWDNFETHGQSMTPLELTVNSLCTRCRNTRLLEPPHVQFIVGHVSPAYEIADLRARGARGREALMLEWFGVLRYTADRRHHYGAALLSTFPSGGPSGVGATLRWSRLGHIGVVWPRERGSRKYATVLSVDLYRFIASGGLSDKRKLASTIAQCASGAGSCVAVSTR